MMERAVIPRVVESMAAELNPAFLWEQERRWMHFIEENQPSFAF